MGWWCRGGRGKGVWREGMYVCASCLQVVEWGGGAGAHASATSLRTKAWAIHRVGARQLCSATWFNKLHPKFI